MFETIGPALIVAGLVLALMAQRTVSKKRFQVYRALAVLLALCAIPFNAEAFQQIRAKQKQLLEARYDRALVEVPDKTNWGAFDIDPEVEDR